MSNEPLPREFQCVIGVPDRAAIGYGDAVILDLPRAATNFVDGIHCCDNPFEGVPEEAGVYLCTIETYWEGWHEDAEPHFDIKTAERIAQWQPCNVIQAAQQ